MTAFSDSLSTVLRYSLADHSDFHKQLVAEPNNRLHSLVYADFLDEQGHPAKAAFIREAVRQGQDKDYTPAIVSNTASPATVDVPDWRLDHIRDGTNHRLALRLTLGPTKQQIVSWLIRSANPESIKSEFGGPLATEGVEVPKYLVPKPEKHSVSDDPLRYSLADHSDFQRAIIAAPDADVNHLAYADWLQEQGKDAHADFIRRTVADKHVNYLDGVRGKHFVTYAPPFVPDAEFALCGSVTPNETGRTHWIDLSPQKTNADGYRSVWSLGPMRKSEAVGMAKSLVAEGAGVDPVVGGWLKPEEPEKHSASERPVRYAAVPNHDIHDDYKPSGAAAMVGPVLNEIAGDNSDAGLLAEGILRTGDHSLLKILADKLDDDNHKHKDTFDWRHLERGIKVDRALGNEIKSRTTPIGGWGTLVGGVTHIPAHPGHIQLTWRDGRRSQLSRKRALTAVRKAVPDANKHDLHHSVQRLILNAQMANNGLTKGHDLPDWYTNLNNEFLKKLGTDLPDSHRYPDTRPLNKRYRLERLRTKYRAVKYAADATDFHSALHRSPDDATAALVYADWLQEQGKEAQAELIRTHVATLPAASGAKGAYAAQIESGLSGHGTGLPPLTTIAHLHPLYPVEQYKFGEPPPPPSGYLVGLTEVSPPKGNAAGWDYDHLGWQSGVLSEEHAKDLHRRLVAEGALSGWPTVKEYEAGMEPPQKNRLRSPKAKYGIVEATDRYRAFTGALRSGNYDQLPQLAESLAAEGPTQAHALHFHLTHLPTLLRAKNHPAVMQAMQTLRKPLRLWPYMFGTKTQPQPQPASAETGEGPTAPELVKTVVMRKPPVKYGLEDEQAFHSKIQENRRETTPALVYADWLQEQGKEGHADIIRQHVEQLNKGARVLPSDYLMGMDDPDVPYETAISASHSVGGARQVYLYKRAAGGDGRFLAWHSKWLPEAEAAQLALRLHREAEPEKPEGGEVLHDANTQHLLRQADPENADKYAAFKSPSGGMVVRESPYAVTGTFATGGQFTRDLTQLSAPAPTQQPKRLSLATLRSRFRRSLVR